MGSEKITYQYLAGKTGFSVATISRVLSGTDSVRAETKAALLKKIEELGYEPADFAVREKRSSGGIIIFNLPSLENPFYAGIIAGAKAAAVQRGYQMLINEEHINDSTIDGFLTMLKKTQAAGLILTNHVAPALLKRIAGEIPLVQCCEYDKDFDLPFVSIDDKAAAYNAMRFLFSLGRKKIAFMNGPIRYKYARERLAGYYDYLETAALDIDPSLIINLPEISYNLAVSAASALFRSGARPDAFFCVSDVFAAAVIKAAHREDIPVPQKLMVVGFDNVPVSWMMNPSITTVSQPQKKLGISACEILATHIAESAGTVENILYETEIIVRESTALTPWLN
ncbi:MAG: LacI family DNA-binding transcriptional regulator [Spirochaetaceae bacterium]|jgi:LacI family repressor for deo operon, udp, cdd, tsx, nupC, and nupG|nr:LacI family DNA-binding transcriptional regulator [Spirochaetaceae bacterium]